MSKIISNPVVRKGILEAYDKGWEEILKQAAVDAVMGSTGLDMAFVKSETNSEAPLSFKTKAYVSGIIGVNAGEIVGSISIMFSREAIFKIASTVYDREITEIDRSVLDCVGEITNLTYGIFKRGTSEKGFGLQTSLPSVIFGEHNVLSLLASRHFSAEYLIDGHAPLFVVFTIDLGKD